jgi:hypothetical protein
VSQFSNFLEAAIINHIFRQTGYTAPTTIAIALVNGTAISDTDTSLAGKEVASSGSYARKVHGPSAGTWDSPAGGGATQNTTAIAFAIATGSWGAAITDVGIMDNATHNGTNLLFYGVLTVAKTITTDDIFQFNIGDLDLVLN